MNAPARGQQPRQTERSKHHLFVIRDKAELDHMLPLIDLLAENGDSIVAWVGSDKALGDDQKIDLLRNICQVGDLDAQRVVKFIDRLLRHRSILVLLRGWVNRLIPLFSTEFRQFLRFNSVVVGWGGFGREPLSLAKFLNIRSICVPHGFNIFKGTRITDTFEDFSNQLPNFSDRHNFSAFIVNNEHTRKFLVDCGMESHRITTLGSLRFTESWSRVLEADLPQPPRVEREPHRKHIIFFLPNPNYRVNWKVLTQLTEALAVSSYRVTVVPHLRGDQDTNASDFTSFIFGLESSAFVVDRSTSLPETLVRNADVVLFSGTSMGLLGLLQGKPTFHLDFVTRNETIFQDLPGSHIESLQDLVDRKGDLMANLQRVGEALNPSEVGNWWGRYVCDRGKAEKAWLELFSECGTTGPDPLARSAKSRLEWTRAALNSKSNAPSAREKG